MAEESRPMVGATLPPDPELIGASIADDPEIAGAKVPDEPDLAGAHIVAPQITSASTGG